MVIMMGLVAATVACAQPGAMSSPDEPAVQELSRARDDVRQRQGALTQREASEALARREAEKAEQALLDAPARDAATLRALARDAADRLGALGEAEAETAEARRLLEGARTRLRKVVTAFGSCGAAPAPGCPAQAATPVDRAALAALVPYGLKAPATAVAIRKRVTEAFATGDGAIAAAASAASAPAGGQPRSSFDVVANAELAYSGAFGVYRDADHVLPLANDLARLSIEFAKCLRDEVATCRAAENGGLAHAQLLAARLRAIDADTQRKLEAVQLASSNAEIGRQYGTEIERKRVAAIRQLIRGNKDAASLFGGESFRLAANKSGTDATIRVDLDRITSDILKDTSLTFSSRLSGDQARFVSTDDGLGSGFRATFSKTWFKPRQFDNQGDTARTDDSVLPEVFAYGWSATVGRDRYTHHDPDNLPDQTGHTVTRMPWSLGLKVASSSAGAQRWHSVGLSAGRAYEAAPASTRCAAVPAAGSSTLACRSASFRGPDSTVERTLTYENRSQSRDGRYAVSFSFKYEDVQALKVFSMPIHLFPGGEKNDALTGGVSITRTSRTRGGDKPPEWTLGVFVGGPFAVFGGFSP
jgi:hypothetical protein